MKKKTANAVYFTLYSKSMNCQNMVNRVYTRKIRKRSKTFDDDVDDDVEYKNIEKKITMTLDNYIIAIGWNNGTQIVKMKGGTLMGIKDDGK